MSDTSVSKALKAQAAQEGAVVVVPKSPLTSKTMLVNLSMAVAGVLLYLADTEFVKQYPAEIGAGLLLASNLINAVLRVFTNSPLTMMVSEEVKYGMENKASGTRLLIMLTVLSFVSTSSYAATIPAADYNFIYANGKYRLVTKENPGGREVTVNILNLDGGTAPTDPTDPTDPADSPGDPFVEEITKITKEVLSNGGTSTTAAALSVVYSSISDAVRSGAIGVDSAFAANRAGADLVLSRQPDKDKWTAWRNRISEDLTTLVSQGALQTKDQYADVFSDIAKGMNAATGFNGSLTNPKSTLQHNPKAGIFSDINITKLIELIRLVMELIKTFSQAQGPMPPAPIVESQQGAFYAPPEFVQSLVA